MIKIIKGVYGYVDKKTGVVSPKTEKDGAFSLPPEKEERLVNLGVAVYVEGPEPAPVEDVEAAEDIARAEAEPALEDMTANELRELGKEYGLTFKVGTKKAEMVEAIKDKWPQPVEEEAEDDGEPLPSFDAAEAVE